MRFLTLHDFKWISGSLSVAACWRVKGAGICASDLRWDEGITNTYTHPHRRSWRRACLPHTFAFPGFQRDGAAALGVRASICVITWERKPTVRQRAGNWASSAIFTAFLCRTDGYRLMVWNHILILNQTGGVFILILHIQIIFRNIQNDGLSCRRSENDHESCQISKTNG